MFGQVGGFWYGGIAVGCSYFQHSDGGWKAVSGSRFNAEALKPLVDWIGEGQYDLIGGSGRVP